MSQKIDLKKIERDFSKEINFLNFDEKKIENELKIEFNNQNKY